jgi:hypothetical protein
VPLIDARDLTGALFYGHFVVQAFPAPHLLDPGPLLREAFESGQRAAGDGWQLLVLAPYDHAYPVAVRFEVWDGEAPDDVDEWPEAVEGGLTVEVGSQVVYDSPTTAAVTCPVPPGRYQVRVTGRASSDDAAWRVQLWPSDAVVPTRRLRSADPRWTPVERAAPAAAESIVDSRLWTERLRVELQSASAGEEHCRRAEAASLLRLGTDPLGPAVVERLAALLGPREDWPELRAELGLVNRGRPILGLPGSVMMGPQCDAAASWRGALLAAGEVVHKGQLRIACPGPEVALSLVGLSRRLGFGLVQVREPTGRLGHHVLVAYGPTALTVVGAPLTAAALGA